MENDDSATRREAGSPAPVMLAREFAIFREEIARLMRRADWERLVVSLARLNQMSEGAGYREICLKAQAVMDLMGRRGAGRELPGDRVIDLIDSLLGVLAHAEWREKEWVGGASLPPVEPQSMWENPGVHGSPRM